MIFSFFSLRRSARPFTANFAKFPGVVNLINTSANEVEFRLFEWPVVEPNQKQIVPFLDLNLNKITRAIAFFYFLLGVQAGNENVV